MLVKCKKDLEDSRFYKGNYYSIHSEGKTNDGEFSIRILNNNDIVTQFSIVKSKRWKFIFSDYFYTKAELRNLKLKKV